MLVAVPMPVPVPLSVPLLFGLRVKYLMSKGCNQRIVVGVP
jgi:hypothetical protein